jgi:hypothetical protein
MSNIEDLINSVMDQDFAKAGPMFSELMQQKLADSLDQEKIKVAGVVFNDEEEFEDDDELEEISDEEIGEIVDEEDPEE